MELDFTVIGCSVAVVSTGIACWALYKWHKEHKQLLNLTVNKYKCDREISKQLVHHYVNIDQLVMLKQVIPEGLDNYHERIASYCNKMCTVFNVETKIAMDVGCGAGKTTFCLSNYFNEVIGIDTSYDMIAECNFMKNNGSHFARLSREGGADSSFYPTKLPDCRLSNVTFRQLDACNLHTCNAVFSLVLVSNSITEMSNPKQFLLDIGESVLDNGILIIADPYLWPNGPEEKFGGDQKTMSCKLIDSVLSTKGWKMLDYSCNEPFYVAESERIATVASAFVCVWVKTSYNEDFEDNNPHDVIYGQSDIGHQQDHLEDEMIDNLNSCTSENESLFRNA